MSQTNFVTVTVTISGSAVPTMNATEKAELRESKETGQIVALVALGIFGLLALVLLCCWGVLCLRRPRKQPKIMTENPDGVRKGKGAFLPIIGRGKRKSHSGAGLEAARGGRSASTSKQSLAGNAAAPAGRRLSMWAEENGSSTPSMPSPPTLAAHSRSSSTASVERVSRYEHHRSTSNLSSQSSHTDPPAQNYGHAGPYHDSVTALTSVPIDGPGILPPVVPPKVGRVDRATPRWETTNSHHEQRVSPIVSPIEDQRFGGSNHLYEGGMTRAYDSGMYA